MRYCAGERVAGASATGPACTTLPAVLAGAGTELEHEVGLPDRGEVVLDDDHGVAEVAQPAEQREQPVGVARVEPDGRLVEHVERVDQARAQGVGERDALGLAARERARLAIEGEVPEADVARGSASRASSCVQDQLRRSARSNGAQLEGAGARRAMLVHGAGGHGGDRLRRRRGPRARPG